MNISSVGERIEMQGVLFIPKSFLTQIVGCRILTINKNKLPLLLVKIGV
jgi:hypothetical protein